LKFTFTSHSTQDTQTLAEQLAPQLSVGDTILLSGSVGAGKTDLARRILQNRMQKSGSIEDVPSPTFTLVQSYEIDGTEFIHSDLYRLTDVDEIYELGLSRAFDDAVTIVEWPDRLGEETPPDALSIDINILSENVRQLQFSWTSPKWFAKLHPITNKQDTQND